MMDYMKKILEWLPRKYLVLIAIGMSLTALDGIIIPSFISGLIDVSSTQKVEDLVKISIIGILSYSLIRLGLFIWEDSQQRMIKQLTLTLKEKIILYITHHYTPELVQKFDKVIRVVDKKVEILTPQEFLNRE